MIITSVFSFYAAPDISNETEQTQGDKKVVQAAGM